MKMLPGGGAHCRTREERFRTPLDFGRTVDELIVVSPFLDAQAPRALDRLGAQTSGPRHLFSRSTSLNALGAEALAGWQCYSLNEAIVNGEERRELPDAEVQELHAKLFISRSGKTTHWHLGSANATNAALGSTNQAPPRNSEFMLRLTTTSPDATPAALLKEWLDNPAGNLFTAHRFEAPEDSEADSYAAALRQLSHQLISAKWQLRAECDADAHYSLYLAIEPSIAIPEGFQIDVGVLCIPGRYDRLPPAPEQQITWTGLALTQISAFIPLRITGPIADASESLVIQAALRLPTDADRSSAILRELVDTPDKLMNYVRLLLHPDSSKEQWEGLGTSKKDGEDGDLFGFDLTSGLLEQLLHAASRRPQQLERVRQLIHRLTRMGMPIPEEFQALWKHFAAYAKETS